MAPKQVAARGARREKGFVSAIYSEITSPENATIVRSILVFGVRYSVSVETASN